MFFYLLMCSCSGRCCCMFRGGNTRRDGSVSPLSVLTIFQVTAKPSYSQLLEQWLVSSDISGLQIWSSIVVVPVHGKLKTLILSVSVGDPPKVSFHSRLCFKHQDFKHDSRFYTITKNTRKGHSFIQSNTNNFLKCLSLKKNASYGFYF